MGNQSLAAPSVSFQYGNASYELSAEGLLRHPLNSRGLHYLFLCVVKRERNMLLSTSAAQCCHALTATLPIMCCLATAQHVVKRERSTVLSRVDRNTTHTFAAHRFS